MSSPSPLHTPRKLRSPTDTESPVIVSTPHSLEDSDSDLNAHLAPDDDEDGYELRPMKMKGATEDEDQKLLGAEAEDDHAGDDEVLYEVDDESGFRTPPRRSRKREFLYTRAEERAVVRKLDKYLVGGLAVLYMLRYADRHPM
jgi:hypothetical protein